MEIENILRIVLLILMIVVFTLMTIYCVRDLKKSNKYWDDMFAHLEVFKASMKKEHDLLKKTQEFGEWLDTFHALMYSNSKFEDTEFNKGTLTAAADIEGKFLEIMGEYVDGKESSD